LSKVNQVTNDEERQLMQGRIIKASIMIEGMPKNEEKARYMLAYDEMVSIMKAYDRAEYCKNYPGVRAIYEQLGWVVGEGKTEPRETSAPNDTESIADAKKSNGESQNEPAAVDEDEYTSAADWL
jgi:hypothetical protein